MKKTLLLLLTFITLAGTSYYFISKDKGQTTIDVSDRRFAVKNPDIIQKIFLANRNQQTVTLERKGDHWIYDGKYLARETVVGHLLNAIEKVDIKSIPAKPAIKNIVGGFATYGIKVELYGKNNEAIRSYYVGGVTQDERGTFMIMEDKNTPFIMHIPGTSKNLRKIYWLPPSEWRDRAVFREKRQQITSVSVEYPLQQSASFKLSQEEGQYLVKPFYDFTPVKPGKANPNNIQEYLSGFEAVIAESFINQFSGKDSILTTKPFAIIEVNNQKNESKKLMLFPNRLPDGRIERYYAYLKTDIGEDFYMTQHRVLEKLLWSYEGFY